MYRLVLPFIVLGAAGICLADEDPDIMPREWIFKDQGVLTGTFLRLEDGRIHLRMEDGSVRQFDLWRAEAKSLAYLQRLQCRMPDTRRRPEPAPSQDPMIDLSAAGLPKGLLQRWQNRGALGGAFHAMNRPPKVEEVEGRKAVTFEYGPWALPMEFQPMVADFYAPRQILDSGSFSVVAWLYNPGTPADRETFLSWQAITGDDGTEIGYGSQGRYPHEKLLNGGAYHGPMGGMGFPDAKFPPANRWNHLAYVFTGGRDGEMRLYVNGELAAKKTLNRIIRNLPATEITQTTATVNADLFLRDGKPIQVFGYVGDRDNHYWRWQRWLHKIDLGQRGPGRVTVPVGDLKPGTRYYFRFLIVADDEQRWSDGAGSFVTAGENGKPGANIEKPKDHLLFLGCHWGSWWDWVAKPLSFYTGSLADLKVYGSALSEQQVRNLYGKRDAYAPSPANGAVLESLKTTLAWKPGAAGAGTFRVYFGTDRATVARGDPATLRDERKEAVFDPGDLGLGQTYFWRIVQVDADGKDRGPGEVWQFTAATGNATEPQPASGIADASVYTARLKWKPGPFAKSQNLYFGADREAVAQGAAPARKDLHGGETSSFAPIERLDYGQTYYWRVEQVNRDGRPASPGEVWSFTVGDYFRLEDDRAGPAPFPFSVRQDGYYGKYLEGDGHPIISTPDCPDEAMRIARHSVLKVMPKRPDIIQAMMAYNCAGHLDYKDRGWGWSLFTCACYGAARNMLSDPTFYWGSNMLMHEMGHQYHMFGCEPAEPDFRHRLREIYLANQRSGKWIGDYGGNNLWEYMAVCTNDWAQDGRPEDLVYPREALRRKDPLMFHFLSDYWPGDTLVELHPTSRLKTTGDGAVVEWGNSGGIEYWGKFGWTFYEATVGGFRPIGSPRLKTVRGVTAVAFGGSDALVWDRTPKDDLKENRAWSVELWAYKDLFNREEETLLAWGPAGERGTRFTWGSGNQASRHGRDPRGQWKSKPDPGRWHHLVYVFKGGGLQDGPGEYRVYVDGRLDSVARHKLALAARPNVVVGGVEEGGTCKLGFAGALAHLRLYNYDLTEAQVQSHYREEAPHYQRQAPHIAALLLVDLDARALARCPQGDDRPTYPESTGRRWLRSWANHGALGGKVHNDVHRPENSDPKVGVVDGVTAVQFDGSDRMVSSFLPFAGRLSFKTGTVEAWVYRQRDDRAGALLQWGPVRLKADLVEPGRWHHLAAALDSDALRIVVDGEPKSSSPAGAALQPLDRLHVGAAWDGRQWQDYFVGAIAQVRVHSGALGPEQIRANYLDSNLMPPALPDPADGGTVVASRRITLRWETGARPGPAGFDVYLGPDRARVAAGSPGDPTHQGRFKVAEFSPALKPDTTYYWRVEAAASDGQRPARGNVWSFRTHRGLLVDLDAAELAPGKLARWTNKGKAAGAFASGRFGEMLAPVVQQVEGRKGVSFAGHKGLVSRVPAPAGLAAGGDFTVAVWAYAPQVEAEATMLAWGNRAQPGAEFIYGWSKDRGAFAGAPDRHLGYAGKVAKPEGWKHNAPYAQCWHHIAYTYAGGEDGVLRVYVDGRLNREEKVRLDFRRDAPITLGMALAGEQRASHFSGCLGQVLIYGSALSAEELAALAAPEGRKPANRKPLVDLDAGPLPEGTLKAWTNRGTFGGSFGLLDEPPTEPTVEDVAGRRAVTFDGTRTFLESDFVTPEAVTLNRPFTIEMAVFNPQVGADETVFSMAPLVAMKSYPESLIFRGVECRYGSRKDLEPGAFTTGWEPRHVGWKTAPPAEGKWHHIAYVYDGGCPGTLRLYVDGSPDAERAYYTLDTMPGYAMHLGTSWNTAAGTGQMFSGSLARLQVYDYARTAEEVREAAAACGR